jgi:hypothetical protein
LLYLGQKNFEKNLSSILKFGPIWGQYTSGKRSNKMHMHISDKKIVISR